MKIRNGFVSNSSSSSFVVLKDALTEKQQDMIINYQEWVKFFINLDEENWKESVIFETDRELYLSDEYQEQQYKRLKYKFEYCDHSPWTIKEYDDCIFGETSMDNFDMRDYLDYIKVDEKYIDWDDGYIDEPLVSQRNAIIRMKQEYRKKKLDKINNQ